jgi:hypothetical protein
MKVAAHLDKFRRLDAMLPRLDPVDDRELWIWTARNAGVPLLNAALHRQGVTRETDSFHSQVEGVYAVPDRVSGALRDEAHEPGDVMHVGQPALPGPLPAAIERACAALRAIEDLREPYVRGSERVAPGEESRWRDAYARCVGELKSTFEAGQPGAP